MRWLISVLSLSTGKHTLQYLYTSISGDDDEFTTIGLVDDSQFMYFDINTMKASPRTEWMRQSETTDYWKSQTAVMIREHNWVRNNVPTKSTGMLVSLSLTQLTHTRNLTWLELPVQKLHRTTQ